MDPILLYRRLTGSRAPNFVTPDCSFVTEVVSTSFFYFFYFILYFLCMIHRVLRFTHAGMCYQDFFVHIFEFRSNFVPHVSFSRLASTMSGRCFIKFFDHFPFLSDHLVAVVYKISSSSSSCPCR